MYNTPEFCRNLCAPESYCDLHTPKSCYDPRPVPSSSGLDKRKTMISLSQPGSNLGDVLRFPCGGPGVIAQKKQKSARLFPESVTFAFVMVV